MSNENKTTGDIIQDALQCEARGIPVDWKSMAMQINDHLARQLQMLSGQLTAKDKQLEDTPDLCQHMGVNMTDRAGRRMTDDDGCLIEVEDRVDPKAVSGE